MHSNSIDIMVDHITHMQLHIEQPAQTKLSMALHRLISGLKNLLWTLGCLQISQTVRSLCAISPQVTDGVTVMGVTNGHPILQKVSATGCLVTSIIAASVLIAEETPVLAACYALGVFG